MFLIVRLHTFYKLHGHHLYLQHTKVNLFVSPELSSVRDYVITPVITHSVHSMYVVCSMCTRSVCMYVVFCKLDHCIHIHWCIVMGLGHNDPWVESHMWPQQIWGQRSSTGQWPLVQVLEKRVSVSTYFDVFSNLILQWLQKYVIAKAGETRGSRTALFILLPCIEKWESMKKPDGSFTKCTC